MYSRWVLILVICIGIALIAAVLGAYAAEPELEVHPGQHIHKEPYIALGMLIVVAILAMGRLGGLRHVALIGSGVLVIRYIMLPLMAKPYHPVAVVALGFFCLSVGVVLAVHRGRPESWGGVIAAAAGFVVAWALASYVIRTLRLTAFNVGEVSLLIKTGYGRVAGEEGYLVALLVSAAIVGAIGAVMDIAVDVSVTIRELKNKQPDISFWDAARGGFHVGTDVVGTMANTLVLAYVGVLLPVFLVAYIRFSLPGMQWRVPLFELINREELSFEWANGLIGTLALVLAVPVVAGVSALLATRAKGLGNVWQKVKSGSTGYGWLKRLWMVVVMTLLVGGADVLLSRQFAIHRDRGGGQVVRAEVVRQLPPVDVDGQPGQLTAYRISSGPLKGRHAIATNIMRSGASWIPPKLGDRQLIRVRTTEAGAIEAMVVYTHERDRKLLVLVWIFLTALILLGGGKGFRTIVGLLSTIGLIFGVFFPLIVAHVPPLAAFAIVAFGSTVITFLAVSGWSPKTMAAVCATLLTLAAMGGLCYATIHWAGLDGLGAGILRFFMKAYSSAEHLDFISLLAAGVLLGLLGALMDVVMAVSSAMHELKSINPELPPKPWMTYGMNVGRSVAAMMSITLLFAYTGGRLALFLYVHRLAGSVAVMFMLSEVLLCILIGILGLVVAVPITVGMNGLVLRLYEARGWSYTPSDTHTKTPVRTLRIPWKWGIAATLVIGAGIGLVATFGGASWQEDLRRADEAYREKKYMEAVHRYWQALDRMPHRMDAADLRRRLLWAYRHVLDAGTAPYIIQGARELLVGQPDAAEVHYLLGVALDREAKLEEALEAYSSAKRMIGTRPLPEELGDLHLRTAMTLSKLRRQEEAVDALLEAAKSPYPQVLLQLARHLREQGNVKGAQAVLKRAYGLAPGDEAVSRELEALSIEE